MSGKERRDTFLTVNFPSDGAVAVGPGAYVSTVKVPMEHMEQILKMPRTDMHANIKSLSLEDATHADTDGVAAFNFLLGQEEDGKGVEPFKETARHHHVDSNGNVNCHHFVVSKGSFPEPGRDMSLEMVNNSSDKEMQAKLKTLGVHTADAMANIHQGMQRIEGTDSNGKSVTKISVDPGHPIRKVLDAADASLFKGVYAGKPSAEALIMEEGHATKVIDDLKKATQDTNVHSNPWIGAKDAVFHMVHHGEDAPTGPSNATFKFTSEGEEQVILPKTKSADGTEVPAPVVPGMKSVTNVRPLEPTDFKA